MANDSANFDTFSNEEGRTCILGAEEGGPDIIQPPA
jgi:hypothetical protein